MNLGRDALRRRKRRAWPVAALADRDRRRPALGGDRGRGHSPGPNYDLLESVSFAFLLALEALTPRRRAVLLLCDVFDYSVKEAAAALGLSGPET